MEMTVKPRSPGQVAISVSLPEKLLEEIDDRAEALGLNRSQYFAQLARGDLQTRPELILRETPSTYGGDVNLDRVQAAVEELTADAVAAGKRAAARGARGAPAHRQSKAIRRMKASSNPKESP